MGSLRLSLPPPPPRAYRVDRFAIGHVHRQLNLEISFAIQVGRLDVAHLVRQPRL